MKVKAVSCPSCGASWGVDKDKTQVFCPYCGTKIVLQNEDGNKSKRTKKIVLAICAMIVLATITVGVWLFVDNISFKEGIKKSIEAAWSEADKNDVPPFLQEITRRSSYEIISVEKGDTCTVDVVVKGVDLGSELKAISYEELPQSEEETAINDFLLDIIENCEIVETPAVIYAKPSGESYEIVFTDTFVDAMSGKIYSYCMDLVGEALEG